MACRRFRRGAEAILRLTLRGRFLRRRFHGVHTSIQHHGQKQHHEEARQPNHHVDHAAHTADRLAAVRAARDPVWNRLETAGALLLSWIGLRRHSPIIAFCDGTPVLPRYNLVVRYASLLPLILCLAACQHGIQTNDAVRQGVLDYLSGTVKLNLQAMDVKVDSVKFDGEKAKATVSIALKGNSTPMMTKQYDLEQKGGKWVVTGREGEAGHGGAMPGAAPGMENPHGGMAMPAPGGSAGGKMPSPEDLPPAGKKK